MLDGVAEARLAAMVAAGRAAWPGVELDAAAFGEFVTTRVAARALADVSAADLWLACAGVARNPAALRRLEGELLPPVEQLLVARGAELVRSFRHQLLHADPPRLAEYRGDPPLAGWLRLLALRELDPRPLLEELAFGTPHPYANTFAVAVRALSPRERTVLRLRLVDRLPLEKIATIYGVHPLTVARWLAAARHGLLSRARHVLREAPGASPRDLLAALRTLPEQLEPNVAQLLAAGDDVSG